MEELNNILSALQTIKLNDKDTIECEIRLFIDGRKTWPRKCITVNTRDDIKKYILKVFRYFNSNEQNVTQSINFITDQGIHQRNFINGVRDKTVCYKKEKIIKDILFMSNTNWSYKLALNVERHVTNIEIDTNNIARIRLRNSIKLNDKFRLDVTLIKTVPNLLDSVKLKEYKVKMFESTNFAEDSTAWDISELAEFELEYIGDFKDLSIDDFSIVDEIPTDKDETEYQKIIYDIAKILNPNKSSKFKHQGTIKQLGNAVKIFTVNEFAEIKEDISNYYVTDKLDGERCFIYINNKKINAVTTIVDVISSTEDEYEYLLDCEKYENKYFIFDVMCFKNENLIYKPFIQRISYVDECLKLCDKFIKKSFIQLNENKSFNEQFKPVTKIYETDGVILTPADGLYNTMDVYKVKPRNCMTIDFYIKQCPKELIGVNPYIEKENNTLYLLFCGIQQNLYKILKLKMIKFYEKIFPNINDTYGYFPIQFNPSDKHFAYLYYSESNDLDGKIGEFLPINENEYELKRIRTDRQLELESGNYFGNNFKFAEITWFSSKLDINYDELDLGYFQKHNSNLHKVSRKFNSHVKYIIFNKISEYSNVLDIASGKGQDLYKYEQRKISRLICVEKDQLAINELINRRYSLRNPMKLDIKQLDLLDNFPILKEKLFDVELFEDGVDYAVCNFAIHYFLRSDKTLDNFARFVSEYVKLNGKFIFSAFNGASIVELMNDNSGEWTIKENEDIKYSIKYKYESMRLDTVGQIINVVLPFSLNEYYSEYVVNSDTVVNTFAKYGFELEFKESFSFYFDDYKDMSLDKNDKKYLSLYYYWVLHRKKILKRK